MKRISLILAAATLSLASTASAIVGGPFDNGDYNALFDETGIYQAAFRFKNGSGFAQFGMNVDITTYTAGGNAANAAPNTVYSLLNRSVFYYKGVTFLGTATGIVDHERKRISGITNGNSDVTTQQATTAQGGASGARSTVTTAPSNLLNNGSVGIPCNSQWFGEITQSQPILRFSGKGEFTVINPNLQQLATQGLQRIISEYDFNPQFTSLTVVGINLQDFLPDIGDQISDLVAGMQVAQNAGDLFTAGVDGIYDNAEIVKMTVVGSRKFFSTRR